MTDKNKVPEVTGEELKRQSDNVKKYYSDPIRNEVYGMFQNLGGINPMFYTVSIPKTKDKDAINRN
jgi:hypothetical protein